MNPEIVEIVKRHINFHTRWCTLDQVNGDEGEVCSCNIRDRKMKLYSDIENLLNKVRSNVKS